MPGRREPWRTARYERGVEGLPDSLRTQQELSFGRGGNPDLGTIFCGKRSDQSSLLVCGGRALGGKGRCAMTLGWKRLLVCQVPEESLPPPLAMLYSRFAALPRAHAVLFKNIVLSEIPLGLSFRERVFGSSFVASVSWRLLRVAITFYYSS